MSDTRATQPPAGWEGLLDPDETIIWQGRPDGGFAVSVRQFGGVVFGALFAGFAVFWMVMAARGGGGFWMFGLIHFCAGMGVLLSALFWGTLRRRRSWYTLTDKRAFIATDIPFRGRSLKSYPIGADSIIDYQHGPLSTIHFGHRTVRRKRGTDQVPVGFERLEDGDDVMRLIRNIQRQGA